MTSNLDLIAQLRAPCGDSVMLLTTEGSSDKFDPLRLAAAREIERLETVLAHMAVESGILRFDANRYQWVRSHWDQLTGLTWREPIAEKFDAYVTEAMRCAPAPESRDG